MADLPADVARCSGVENDDGTWREGCKNCRRRTDRSFFPQAAWMAPPLIVVFECEARIAPDNVGANRAAEGGPVERPVGRPVEKRG